MRTTQEVVQLRRNTSRAVRPKYFVEPPSEFLEQEPVLSETFEVASRCNILEIYKRMGMEDAYGDIDNLPSLKVRKALSEKDAIDEKAFRTIERVFRKGVVGIMKLLLPSWKLPEIATIKQLFKIVEEPDASTCKSEKEISIDNVAIMKSLVLKRDVSDIYQQYVIKHSAQFPNTPAMKKSLFYTIINLITGGSKKQQIRAGVDYIKVNYHTDNYQLVDKVIDIVAPASDADQTVREQLYPQRSTVFTVES